MRKTYTLIVICMFRSLLVFSQCNTADNIAYGKMAYASSLEGAGYPASKAFDGDINSRWSSAFSDPQYIYVDLGIVYPLCQVVLYWQSAYGKNFTIDISNDASSWTTVATITGNTSLTNTISISGSARYVRMYGTLRATGYGYSLKEFEVYSSQASSACPSTNIALNQSSVASSLENASLSASKAFDGNTSSRWSSAFSDPQYIYVDLGTNYWLCNVTLNWQASYGKDFTIDVSDNASSWTNLATITGNTLTTNIIPVNGTGRYVRMYGTARATSYGYSLLEFNVNGFLAVLDIKVTSFNVINEAGKNVLFWKTQEKTNIKSFVIERSIDMINYDSIGYVNAKNNVSTTMDYHYTDYFSPAGISYYRLKEVNMDGKYNYSKTVSITHKPVSGIDINMFPDPIKDILNVKNNGEDLLQSVMVYSLNGVNVAGKQKIAANMIAIPMYALPKGMYIVHVTTTQHTRSFKVIKN